jgi:hypothetical protein
VWLGTTALALVASPLVMANAARAATIESFTAGDLVVSVEGDGSNTGSYLDNQAAPMTLYEYHVAGVPGATLVGSLTLPQTASGSNHAFSGEYGSSSEGMIQLTGNGQALTIMGYGVNANTYNSTYDVGGTGTALAQSTSTLVPRVIALIGANGSINTSTALTNVFSGNNPRSVYSANGTSFYISGQGTKGDATGGVFTATLGATTATPVTGLDATYKSHPSSQDTRVIQQYNGQTYVSVDTSTGSPNRSYIATLGANGSLTPLNGMASGTVSLNGTNGNSINGSRGTVNLSPDDFFFANSTTLYIADTGAPKVGSTLGDGGLQKWSLEGTGVGATWVLDYTLSAGLNLVKNTQSTGTTGLYALTGEVVGNNVELFATNYTAADTDQTYLYGISDVLADMTNPGNETFSVLATAPTDSNFKGVSFAPSVSPVPVPGAMPMFAAAIAGFGGFVWRKSRRKAAKSVAA